jgi:hypothetical protein
MDICHVGSSILQSPNNGTIHLNKILHVSNAQKSLFSINRLACDNNVFLEFHPDYFSIKEWDTKRMVLQGRCEGGLYPLKIDENK